MKEGKSTPQQIVERIQAEMRKMASESYIGTQEAALERNHAIQKKMQAMAEEFMREYPLEILTKGRY